MAQQRPMEHISKHSRNRAENRLQYELLLNLETLRFALKFQLKQDIPTELEILRKYKQNVLEVLGSEETMQLHVGELYCLGSAHPDILN